MQDDLVLVVQLLDEALLEDLGLSMVLALLLQLVRLHHVPVTITTILEQHLVTDDQCLGPRSLLAHAGPFDIFAVAELVCTRPRVQKVLVVERRLILGLTLLITTQFDLLHLVHLVAALHFVQVVFVERQEMHDLCAVLTFLFELSGPIGSQLLG